MVLRAKVFKSYPTSSRDMGVDIRAFPAVESSPTSATLVGANPHRVLRLIGTGLTYDSGGYLVGGTVLRVEVSQEDDEKAIVVTGFEMNVAQSVVLENDPVWNLDASEMTEAGEDGKGAVFVAEGGADTLVGSQFGDDFEGYYGRDSLVGGLGSDTLSGGQDNDTLEGGDGRDFLDGGRGNDKINGGGGRDMIISRGHRVNDNQSIDLGKGTHRSDQVGSDKLTSIESFFGGDGDDTIIGSDGANTLIGGWGADLINGKGGRDEIWMGNGADTVTGGPGQDLFVFDYYGAGARAELRDFKPGTDTIGLAKSTIPLGPLAAGSFRNGSSARDDDDFVIYNRAKGKLWIDQDGDGDLPKVLIATLLTKPALDASDFIVMQVTGDWWLL